jgi:hypothetical protein
MGADESRFSELRWSLLVRTGEVTPMIGDTITVHGRAYTVRSVEAEDERMARCMVTLVD